MIVYRDMTHCRGYENSNECKKCYRFFNRKEYKAFCRRFGFKIAISFYTKPLCEQGKEKAEL